MKEKQDEGGKLGNRLWRKLGRNARVDHYKKGEKKIESEALKQSEDKKVLKASNKRQKRNWMNQTETEKCGLKRRR